MIEQQWYYSKYCKCCLLNLFYIYMHRNIHHFTGNRRKLLHAVGAIIIEQRERGESSSYFCQSNLYYLQMLLLLVDICIGHMYIYSDSEFKKSLSKHTHPSFQILPQSIYIGVIAPPRKSFGFEQHPCNVCRFSMLSRLPQQENLSIFLHICPLKRKSQFCFGFFFYQVRTILIYLNISL